MAIMSEYLQAALTNHIFRAASFDKPTTLALALCTTSITAADTGATISEVADANGYARQTLNPANGNWMAWVDGYTSNNDVVDFPTATGNWGTITSAAILDSAEYGEGNLLFYGDLSSIRPITSGITFRFSVGDIQVSFDN